MATEEWRLSERKRRHETWKRNVTANRMFWDALIKAATATNMWRLKVHEDAQTGEDPETGDPVQLDNTVRYVEFFIGDEKVGQVRETRHGGSWSYRGQRRYRVSGPHVPAARYRRYSWGDEHRDYKKVDSAIKSMKEWFRIKNPKERLRENWESDPRNRELQSEIQEAQRQVEEARRWLKSNAEKTATFALHNGKLDDTSAIKVREFLDAKNDVERWNEELSSYRGRFEAQFWDFEEHGKAKAINEY